MNTPAEALVIVPFPTIDDAHEWVNKVSIDYPDVPPLLVTAGAETVMIDPNSGDSRQELTFAGGWRAKVADVHSGVVTIARPNDSRSESVSGHRHG